MGSHMFCALLHFELTSFYFIVICEGYDNPGSSRSLASGTTESFSFDEFMRLHKNVQNLAMLNR